MEGRKAVEEQKRGVKGGRTVANHVSASGGSAYTHQSAGWLKSIEADIFVGQRPKVNITPNYSCQFGMSGGNLVQLFNQTQGQSCCKCSLTVYQRHTTTKQSACMSEHISYVWQTFAHNIYSKISLLLPLYGHAHMHISSDAIILYPIYPLSHQDTHPLFRLRKQTIGTMAVFRGNRSKKGDLLSELRGIELGVILTTY